MSEAQSFARVALVRRDKAWDLYFLGVRRMEAESYTVVWNVRQELLSPGSIGGECAEVARSIERAAAAAAAR